MKTGDIYVFNSMRIRVLTMFAVLTAFALPTFSQASETMTTPAEIVNELVEAMDANDADRIRAVFAADAGQRYRSGSYKTGDAFFAWLQSDIIGVEGRVADPVISVDGNAVTLTGQYRNNSGYTSAADFLLEIKDGKITTWTMRY